MVCAGCGKHLRHMGRHARACSAGSRFARAQLSPAAREYLAAFDDLLGARDHTDAVGARDAMGTWREVMLADAGVVPQNPATREGALAEVGLA